MDTEKLLELNKAAHAVVEEALYRGVDDNDLRLTIRNLCQALIPHANLHGKCQAIEQMHEEMNRLKADLQSAKDYCLALENQLQMEKEKSGGNS